MCGICGAVAGNYITESETANIQKLMILATFRGEDSSGMFDYCSLDDSARETRLKREQEEFEKDTKNKRKKFPEPLPHRPVLYWKTLEHPVTFSNRIMSAISSARWGLPENELRAVTCHARAATVGKVIQENAHPFHVGDLIGVHNGTITGTFNKREKFDTDSEALYHNIYDLGIEKALKTIDTDATNLAYALVWLDTTNKTLNIIRNSQRPLHYLTKTGTTYFASDKKDLAYTFNESLSSIKEFKEEMLYTFDLNGGYSFKEQKLDVTRSFRSVYPYPSNDSNYMDGRYSEYNRSSYHPNNVPALTGLEDLNKQIQNDRRDKAVYTHQYKKKTVNQMSALSSASYSYSKHPHYEILFNRYFTDFLIKMWNMWKEDHKEEYETQLGKLWSSIDEKTKDKLLVQCDQIPECLKVDKDNKVIFLRDHKKSPDFTMPFGIEGMKCTLQAWFQKTARGCTWCGNPVQENERLFWSNRTDFLCENCQELAYGSDRHAIHKSFDTTKLEEFINNMTADDALPPSNTTMDGLNDELPI